MPYYVYAWIGAIASGFIVLTAKLTSKHSISNPWLFNFLLVIVSLLFTIPPAIAYKAGLPNDWTPIIFAAIFSTLFNIFWIFSTYSLDVSVLSPLFNFRGIFAVLIGAIFLNESFSNSQIVYMVVIIMAGVFVSLDEKFRLKSFFTKSIALGILTCFFLAVNNSFIKVSVIHNNLWVTNLWIAIINVFLLIPTIPFFKNHIKAINLKNVVSISALGFFSVVTEFSANYAYGVNVGITSLIMNTPFSMIFAFLFSIFAPKLLEKHSLKVYAIRFTSTAVMIYCAMQIVK